MTLKEMMAALAAKKAAGQAKLAELRALEAKAPEARAAEDTAKITALDAELEALERDVADLAAQVHKAEASKRRGELFAAAARPAYGQAARGFDADPARTFGFKSMADFAVCVANVSTGGSDARMTAAASNYMQNQGAAGEGYLVPPEFSQTVWEIALANDDLLGMVGPEPTKSNAVFKPKDETTPWGSAGVQAYWRAESAQMTASRVAIGGELMTLHELYAFCSASQELLDDAPMLQDRLTRQAGRAIQWKASEAIMWGTGAGMPTGFMNSPALITAPKDAGQAAATLTLNNLLNMLKQVLRIGGKPMWFANQDIIAQLAQLSLGNVPVWLPLNQGLQDSPFDGVLLGYPLMFTEHAQTLGQPGDITCANMAGYYAATKQGGGLDFASSMHLYFDQNMTAFRWTFRLAGQPYLSKPVAPAKGATSKSHFVNLALRA